MRKNQIKKFFLIFVIILFSKINSNNLIKSKFKQESIRKDKNKKFNIINGVKSGNTNFQITKCFLPSDNFSTRIIHLIFTRFIMEFNHLPTLMNFKKTIYRKDYIKNGIRVMNKYLLPSLDNQNCKDFVWILTLGDKANKTFVESLFHFNYSFEYKIIYNKSLKNYVRNISKGFNILITSRIDYDDIIYYDAVNDVRKAINSNKPMILYGYNRGIYYFEKDNKYYDFYETYNNEGTMSIFNSLITVLNKVNDSYTINDIGGHSVIRKNLLESYKSFGIKKLNYEPAIFDSGDAKFIYVRQNFSITYRSSKKIKNKLKLYDFNIING